MFLLPAAVAAASLVAAPDPPKLELKDGDRVVWIGNTLVEREQRYGYWETALHAAYPKTSFTVRNLGWSGDTVYGDARAGFDTPEKGFERLVSLTLELKPTVIFVSYGQNESFDGEAGLSRFEKGLNRLLDTLKPANARVVLFTPLGRLPWYDGPAAGGPKESDLRRYTEVVRATAGERKFPIADFGESVSIVAALREMRRRDPENAQDRNLRLATDNGLHLTEVGYQLTAWEFLRAMGHVPGPAFDWDRLDPLRQAIVTKNELFFHRWRPQNETYLFGFRKHEQGKNAKEVAEFDPLVKKAEDEIERIKKGLAK